MPEHLHALYPDILKNIQDTIYFGNNVSMKKIMCLYNNIDNLLKEDIPYCSEGFLWKHILNTKIINRRFIFNHHKNPLTPNIK